MACWACRNQGTVEYVETSPLANMYRAVKAAILSRIVPCPECRFDDGSIRPEFEDTTPNWTLAEIEPPHSRF